MILKNGKIEDGKEYFERIQDKLNSGLQFNEVMGRGEGRFPLVVLHPYENRYSNPNTVRISRGGWGSAWVAGEAKFPPCSHFSPCSPSFSQPRNSLTEPY